MIVILSIAAMVLSCFFSLILKKQEVALLLVFFSFEFIFNYGKDVPLTLYVIPTFCGFLSVVGNNAKNKVLWLLLFWFLAYYCLIAVFGPYSKPVYGWILRTLSLVFLFLWVMLIKWDRKNIFFIIFSYGAYWLAWGFLEKLILDPPRIGGPLNSPTGYAMILCILWSIWFVDACKQRKNIFMLTAGTSLVLLAIIFSGARMGIIGLCIGVLFGIYSYVHAFAVSQSSNSAITNKIKFLVTLLFTSVIFIIIWNVFMKDLLIARTMESILHGKIDPSNMGRLVAWFTAYDMFYNHKIWGVGPDTFSEFYSKFLKNIPNVVVTNKVLPHAHNEYLQTLAEFGLLGFIHLSTVILFCVFSIVNYMRKNKNETVCYGIMAGFLILLVLILVDGTPSFGFIPWIIGVMASYYMRERNCLQK